MSVNLCQTLTLLILIFPAFIFGLECYVGGYCSKNGNGSIYIDPNTTSKQLCESCAYFACDNGNSNRMIGYGCYEDFENVCKYIPTNTKEYIKQNAKGYFKYFDQIVVYASSDYDTQSAHDIYDHANEQYQNLHKPENKTLDDVSECEYDGAGTPNLLSVQCSVKQACLPSTTFFHKESLKKPTDYPSNKTKTCNACVTFMCTNDNKQILTGSGCYEEFVHACGSIVKGGMKEMLNSNIRNSYIIGQNYLLQSCSNENDCFIKALPLYNDVNKIAIENITSIFDKDYNGVCTYPPVESKTAHHLIHIGMLLLFGLNFILFGNL